jgi:hypothetical protein
MKNHSLTPTSYLVKRNADGSTCPQDLQRAKQVFGLAHDDEVAMLANWCGKTSIVAQCGILAALLTCNAVEAMSSGLLVTHGVPQLQIVGEADGFEGLMNELARCPTLGLVLGEHRAGQWAGGVLLQGASRSVMLCFDPLSALARRLVRQWQDTDQVSVLFANPHQGMRTEQYDLKGAKTPATMLALPTPAGYQFDALKTWEGMQWLAAQHNDPDTVYLAVLEETEVAKVFARH